MLLLFSCGEEQCMTLRVNKLHLGGEGMNSLDYMTLPPKQL